MHRKVGPPCCTTDTFERHRGVHGHEARNRAHAKGDTLGSDCPLRVQLCTNCLSIVYVMKGMAELALCRIIWGSAQRHTHARGVTTTKKKKSETYGRKEAAEARPGAHGVVDQFCPACYMIHLGRWGQGRGHRDAL